MAGVKRYFVNNARRNNHTRYGFMGFKSTTAIDVLTLVITFFCLTRKIAAALSVGRCLANRAMHHDKTYRKHGWGRGCMDIA